MSVLTHFVLTACFALSSASNTATSHALGIRSAIEQDARVACALQHGPGDAEQDSMKVLTRLAGEAVNGNDSFLGKTRFSINQQKRTFFYDGNPVPADLVLSNQDTLARPLEALIRIEALRRDFEAAIPTDQFWHESSDSIVQAIRSCVQRPPPESPDEDVKKSAKECSSGIEKQFDNLKISVFAFAAGHRLEFAEPIKIRDPVVGYRVNVEINPPRARVRVMTLLQYKKYQYFHTSRENYQWNDLLSSENVMIGWYHYRAEWPSDLNGPEEGDFEIKGPITVKFVPAPR